MSADSADVRTMSLENLPDIKNTPLTGPPLQFLVFRDACGTHLRYRTKFLAMTYKGEKIDKNIIRKALLEYCKQDTQGMIDILNVLQKCFKRDAPVKT